MIGKLIIYALITFSFIIIRCPGEWLAGSSSAFAQETSKRVTQSDIKVQQEYLLQLQERVWQMEKRIQEKPNDKTAQENLRELNEKNKKLGVILRGLITARVAQIISEQLGVDINKVTQDASVVEDLGADSLDVVELVMAFEEDFVINIPDEEAKNLVTVKDITDYLMKKSI